MEISHWLFQSAFLKHQSYHSGWGHVYFWDPEMTIFGQRVAEISYQLGLVSFPKKQNIYKKYARI